MIQKSGDYYIYEDSVAVEKNKFNVGPTSLVSSQSHQAIGNVKQKLEAIRQRFNQIKKERQEFDYNQIHKQGLSVLQKVKPTNAQSLQQLDIEVFIPDQILQLDQRLSKIQQKIKPNEIFKRKMENKGKLVQRIKLLHHKLKSVLEKSSEIIVNNIQNYCASLDDKEDYLKLIFLKQAHSKVKGMKEEIIVVESYLKNLNFIQTKIKALEPISKTIKTHTQIIQLKNKLSIKINQLFSHMKNIYSQILQQIDSIPL